MTIRHRFEYFTVGRDVLSAGDPEGEMPSGGMTHGDNSGHILEAMERLKADTRAIRHVVSCASQSIGRLSFEGVPTAVKEFVETTFRFISKGSPATAFAFGREDAIPAMFRMLIGNLNHELDGDLDQFIWYLERHIEVDGEDHEPLSLKLVVDLCGNHPALWEEASQAAEEALRARLSLWDGVLAQNRKAPEARN